MHSTREERPPDTVELPVRSHVLSHISSKEILHLFAILEEVGALE